MLIRALDAPVTDANVNLATYVYKDEMNTGLTGVGLTERNLTTYTGPTGDFQIFGDFGPNNNILVEYNYLPATDGGYSCTLGFNPGKPFGDNPTYIVFRHNIFGRGSNGKGGAFGTVTSFDESGEGNQYYDNIWQDTGTPVPANA
jgi:hypothetical protein